MSTETQPRPDNWARLGRAIGQIFKFLLRLVFVILLAIGLGLGVYYGVPWAYRTLIQPVQTHTTQIAALTQHVNNLSGSLDDSQAAQDARLTTLETSQDALRQRTSALESSAAEWQTPFDVERTAREALEAEVTALKAEVAALTAEATASRKLLAEITATTASVTETVTLLKGQLNVETLWLQSRIDLLQAKSQLDAENFGLARQLLSTSQAKLAQVVNTLATLPVESRALLVNQLAAADALILAQPAAALEELANISGQLDSLIHPSASGELPR